MARTVGAFGPVRFPVYPPSGSESLAQSEGIPQAPELEHVHGFHIGARPPALFLAENRAAVAAGKLVVVMDIGTRKQSFIRGHTEAVTCLAYSADQGFGASGQLMGAGSKFAEVLIWSPEELQPCSSLIFHQADVETIGFIQGGEFLVTVSADRDHTLALWSVAKDRALRARRKEKNPLVVCSAYKSGSVHGTLAAPEREGQVPQFVTFGVAHLKFWKSERLSPNLSSRRGAFGPEGAPRVVVHVAWTASGRLVAGGSEGQIYFFDGTRAIRCIQQHKQCVSLLVPLRDALLVVYAHGLCSLLRSGDSVAPDRSEPRSVDVDLASLPGAPDARMQSPIIGGKAWRQSSMLLASKTHLLLVDLAGGLREPRSCSVLLTQASKQVTAVCAHPAEPRFYAGSLDGAVRCFANDTHDALPTRSFKASSGVTCLAASGSAPGSSAWLAVGCEDSSLCVLGEAHLNYAFRRNLAGRGETKTRLTCARFSSCDCSGMHPLWLAVGADDGSIHTFRFKDPACKFETHTGPETITKVATLRGHRGAVVEIAFASTIPCEYLLSVDACGQVLAFDVPAGRRLSSTAIVRDVPFSPWTLPIGWHVLGCWSPQRAAPTVASPALPARRFAEIAGRSMIAVSNVESQAVELFPFPCPASPSQPIPRLDGPASLVSALLHCGRSGKLLAASDALLFVWAWSSRPTWEVPVASPLRAKLQNADAFETPESRKHALATEDGALLMTPQAKHPAQYRNGAQAKENVIAGRISAWPEPTVEVDYFVPPGKQGMSTPTTSPSPEPANPSHNHVSVPLVGQSVEAARDGSPWIASGSPHWRGHEGYSLEHGMPEVAPLPGEPREILCVEGSPAAPSPWRLAQDRDEAFLARRASSAGPHPRGHSDERMWTSPNQRDRAGQREVFVLGGGHSETNLVEAPRPQRWGAGKDLVSPKIGTAEAGMFGKVASITQQVRADTVARARSVHERQQCDTVGWLMGGSDRRSNSVGAVTERKATGRACSAGQFVYRAREYREHDVQYFEVDAHLPGGRLLRVTRNPLRRTLTFEGEVASGRSEQPLPISAHQHGRTAFADELVLQIPPGFDLIGPPAHVERMFAEGRCLVVLRGGGGRGVAQPQAPAWGAGDL